jgi:hypothetical protein
MLIKLIPTKGRKPINPKTMNHLSENGILVTKLDRYWLDRLNDGDIKTIDMKIKKEGVK